MYACRRPLPQDADELTRHHYGSGFAGVGEVGPPPGSSPVRTPAWSGLICLDHLTWRSVNLPYRISGLKSSAKSRMSRCQLVAPGRLASGMQHPRSFPAPLIMRGDRYRRRFRVGHLLLCMMGSTARPVSCSSNHLLRQMHLALYHPATDVGHNHDCIPTTLHT